jgi:hypothetical protein
VNDTDAISTRTKSKNNNAQILLFILTLSQTLASSVPISINGQLLTTKELNSKEHQVIFRKVDEYATYVIFHHIPISLERMNQTADKAIKN